MYNMEFGQTYCKDFLKRNPKKFILYFYDFTKILHEFCKFSQISTNN
jgi:hypothetical protein